MTASAAAAGAPSSDDDCCLVIQLQFLYDDVTPLRCCWWWWWWWLGRFSVYGHQRAAPAISPPVALSLCHRWPTGFVQGLLLLPLLLMMCLVLILICSKGQFLGEFDNVRGNIWMILVFADSACLMIPLEKGEILLTFLGNFLFLSLSNLFGERGHAAFLHCRIYNCWLRCVSFFLMRVNSLSFFSFLHL